MFIALISLLVSFGITTLGYYVFQQRYQSSEVTRVRRRLGVETEAERIAESGAPALIRSGDRDEPHWLRALGPYLRINEKLQSLIESAGVTSTPVRVHKQCAMSALLGAVLMLLLNQQFGGPPMLSFLALPAGM